MKKIILIILLLGLGLIRAQIPFEWLTPFTERWLAPDIWDYKMTLEVIEPNQPPYITSPFYLSQEPNSIGIETTPLDYRGHPVRVMVHIERVPLDMLYWAYIQQKNARLQN